MKYFLPILSLFLSSLSVQAKEMPACDRECFKKKYQCNIDKSHSYNNCSDDLFSCRASCKSGKTQNSYSAATLPIEIAFHPTLTME